jgi:hypothetical protein
MLSRSIRLGLVLCALAPVAAARAATVWTPVTTGTAQTINGVGGVSENQLVLVTSAGGVFHGSAATGFVGSGVTPTSPAGGFNDVAMSPDGTHGVAVGNAGAIFWTHDSGANWAQVTVASEPNKACGGAPATLQTLHDPLSSVQFANASTAY